MANILSRYVPEQAALQCTKWIVEHKVHFKITQERKTVHGDYRPPQRGRGHRISVNGSLNPYNFLLTFTHEMAHLIVWNKFQDKVAPHGKEWKYAFAQLMKPFLSDNIFPEDLLPFLTKYLANPAASSSRDPELYKALRRYDKEEETQDGFIFLEDLEEGKHFQTEDGRIFQKNNLLRKYYKCTEIKTKKAFRINGLLKVKPV